MKFVHVGQFNPFESERRLNSTIPTSVECGICIQKSYLVFIDLTQVHLILLVETVIFIFLEGAILMWYGWGL